MSRSPNPRRIIALQSETWEVAEQIAYFLDSQKKESEFPKVLTSNQLTIRGLLKQRSRALTLCCYGISWEHVTKVLGELFQENITQWPQEKTIEIKCQGKQPLKILVNDIPDSEKNWWRNKTFKIEALGISPLDGKFFDPFSALPDFTDGKLELNSKNLLISNPERVYGAIHLASLTGLNPEEQALFALEDAVNILRESSGNFPLVLQQQLIKEAWIGRAAMETLDLIGLRDNFLPIFKNEDLPWLEFLRLVKRVEILPKLEEWYFGSNKLPILTLIMLVPFFRRELKEMPSMRSQVREFLQRHLPLVGPALSPPNVAAGLIEDALYTWLLTKKEDFVWQPTQERLRVTYTFAERFFEVLKLPDTAFSHLEFSTGTYSLPPTQPALTTDELDIYLDSTFPVNQREPWLEKSSTLIRKQRRQLLTIPYPGVVSFLMNRKNRLVTILDIEAREDITDEELLRLDGTVQILSQANERLLSKGFPAGKEFVLRILLGDTIPTNLKCPVFSFARPSGYENPIIMPDWSFVDNYASTLPYNWDLLRRKVNDHAPLEDLGKRKALMHFSGITKKAGYGIRRQLQESDLDFLSINSCQPSRPATETILQWRNFKYLLDIPEQIPWSTRFKELFLLRSVVIKVNILNQNSQPWLSFFANRFVRGEDYIAIDHNPYDDPTGVKILKALEKIYSSLEKNPEGAQEIANRGFNKALKLSERLVIEYTAWLLGNYYRNYWEHEDYQ